MGKRTNKKQEVFTLRSLILLAWCGFLGLLLAAENFAHYRHDYVFQDWLPVLLPCLASAAAIGLVLTIVLYCVKGRKDTGRIFSLPFVLYLLTALVLVLGVPCFVMKGVGLNIFKLTTRMLGIFLIFYFMGWLLQRISLSLSMLALATAVWALLPIVYYVVYCSPSAAIMMSVQYAYLSPVGAGIAFTLSSGVVTAVLLILSGCKPSFRIKKICVLSMFALSVITIWLCILLPVESSIFMMISYGAAVLQVLLLGLFTLLKKLNRV